MDHNNIDENTLYKNMKEQEVASLNAELLHIDDITKFYNSPAGQYFLNILTQLKKQKLEELITKSKVDDFLATQAEVKALINFENSVMFLNNQETAIRNRLAQIFDDTEY